MQAYPETPIGTKITRAGTVFTMTEEGWRAESQHLLHRFQGWDYCKPWIYLVTIGCQHHDILPEPIGIGNDEELLPLPEGWTYPQWLKDCYEKPGRPHLFGELAGNSAEEAHIGLNPLGQAVDAAILRLPIEYPQLQIIERTVMPNHIHIVIYVRSRLPEKTPLGTLLNRLKSHINRLWKELALGLPATTLMDLRYQTGGVSEAGKGVKSGTVKNFQSGTENTKTTPAPRSGHGSKNPKIGLVFEPNFHDRILFRQGQLQRMIEYCRNNPKRLWQIVHNREYFERLMAVRVMMPYVAEGGTKGRGRWVGEKSCLLAPLEHNLSANGEPLVTGTFSMIGNRSLLTVPERLQIQCSRSATTTDIEAFKAQVLAACEHGVVPVSPCISPGEKAIARAVLDAEKPLIVLFPQGIPSDLKNKAGFGPYFDACAAGRLLILSPWEYSDKRHKLERWQCLFLNDVAAQISIGAKVV